MPCAAPVTMATLSVNLGMLPSLRVAVVTRHTSRRVGVGVVFSCLRPTRRRARLGHLLAGMILGRIELGGRRLRAEIAADMRLARSVEQGSKDAAVEVTRSEQRVAQREGEI